GVQRQQLVSEPRRVTEKLSESESIRRTAWRPHQTEQSVLLRLVRWTTLSGKTRRCLYCADRPGASGNLSISDRERARRQRRHHTPERQCVFNDTISRSYREAVDREFRQWCSIVFELIQSLQRCSGSEPHAYRSGVGRASIPDTHAASQ